jgi:hypothetical protein
MAKQPLKPPATYSYEFTVFRTDKPSEDRVLNLTLKTEIVPLGMDRRSFAGYPTYFHALAVANTRATIALIYQVATDPMVRDGSPRWFGSFRVFDTGTKPQSLRGEPTVPPFASGPLPPGALNVQLTKLFEQPGETNWEKRVAADLKGRASSAATYNNAKQIVLDFARSTDLEVYANAVIERSAGDDKTGLVILNNINIDYRDGLGSADGYTSIADQSGPDGTGKYCDRQYEWPPFSYIALTRNSFLESTHPIFQHVTLAHEARHLYDNQRAEHLLKLWKKTRKGSFEDWVRKQASRRNSLVTLHDYLNAQGLCKTVYGIQAEKLAHWRPHIEGWILTITYAPIEHLAKQRRDRPGPAASDFVKIQKDYYPISIPDELARVMKLLGTPLQRTYERLSPARQKVVRDQIAYYYTKIEPKAGLDQPFLNWLKGLWKISRWD